MKYFVAFLILLSFPAFAQNQYVGKFTGNGSGLTNITGFTTTGGSGPPLIRRVEGVNGDNSHIEVDETSGQRFYDSFGTEQAYIDPNGLHSSSRTLVVSNFTAASSTTNLLATDSNGNEKAIPWASLPAGGGVATSSFPTNELLVSQGGSDILGQRGTTNAFASVHAAVKASQNGDIITVQAGSYNEGTNVAGIPPKNLSIICYGLATLQYTLTNGQTGLNITNIYLHPADNLYVQNIYGFTTQSNFFSAFFGTGSTNDTGTATNVVLNNVWDNFCDSDGFYFGGTNLVQGSFYNCGSHHYWDGNAILGNLNTNSWFYFQNCSFNCDRSNGVNPSIRSGVNFSGAPAGVNIYFYNSTVSIANTNKSSNFGIRVGAAKLWLNGVGFGVPHNGLGSPPWADLDYVNQFVDGGSAGILYSTLQTNFQLVVYNGTTTAGFPLNLLGSFLYGSLTVPLTQSSDATDDVGPPYGSWGLGDEGTNGTMSETNIGNLNAVNPSYIEHTPESENQTTPVSGKFALHNMGLQLYGTYDSVAFSDVEPNELAILASNKTDAYLVKSSGVIGKIATGSSFVPQVIITNFQSGLLYTNNYGVPITVLGAVPITTAAVAGSASMALVIKNNTTLVSSNTVGQGTIVTGLALSYSEQLSGFVPVGDTYIFTNLSSGAGNSATINVGPSSGNQLFVP